MGSPVYRRCRMKHLPWKISNHKEGQVKESSRNQGDRGNNHLRIIFPPTEWLCGPKLYSTSSASFVSYIMCPLQDMLDRFDYHSC